MVEKKVKARFRITALHVALAKKTISAKPAGATLQDHVQCIKTALRRQLDGRIHFDSAVYWETLFRNLGRNISSGHNGRTDRSQMPMAVAPEAMVEQPPNTRHSHLADHYTVDSVKSSATDTPAAASSVQQGSTGDGNLANKTTDMKENIQSEEARPRKVWLKQLPLKQRTVKLYQVTHSLPSSYTGELIWTLDFIRNRLNSESANPRAFATVVERACLELRLAFMAWEASFLSNSDCPEPISERCTYTAFPKAMISAFTIIAQAIASLDAHVDNGMIENVKKPVCSCGLIFSVLYQSTVPMAQQPQNICSARPAHIQHLLRNLFFELLKCLDPASPACKSVYEDVVDWVMDRVSALMELEAFGAMTPASAVSGTNTDQTASLIRIEGTHLCKLLRGPLAMSRETVRSRLEHVDDSKAEHKETTSRTKWDGAIKIYDKGTSSIQRRLQLTLLECRCGPTIDDEKFLFAHDHKMMDEELMVKPGWFHNMMCRLAGWD